jgi:uncharacterized protein YegP (UPF0339 family)
MIYCVWYPSGGFGHFVNAILTLHGQNFVRPGKSLKFSTNGNSHNLDLVVPKYFKDCWPGSIEFVDSKNYCVLVDNGINNESTQFKSQFPDSTVVKICYSDYSWPVVARTMIEKAMRSSIDTQLPVDHNWHADETWARREKYFLFLRDHAFRYAWKANNENSIDVSEIYLDYEECFAIINSVAKTDHFADLWIEWRKANAKYIDPVITAMSVLSCVAAKVSEDLTHIDDVWTQAVIYYYIWVRYNVEIPHNDFADFFTNTDQIQELVS